MKAILLLSKNKIEIEILYMRILKQEKNPEIKGITGAGNREFTEFIF